MKKIITAIFLLFFISVQVCFSQSDTFVVSGIAKQKTGNYAGAIEDFTSAIKKREQEVLKMVALGHTSAEIAEQLNLSAKTVETYRARGMEKLGLRTRAALVKFALQEGLSKRD